MLKKADLISRTCVVMDHIQNVWENERDLNTRAAFLYEYICPMILTVSLFSPCTKERARQFLNKYAINPESIDTYTRDRDVNWLWDLIAADHNKIRKLNAF